MDLHSIKESENITNLLILVSLNANTNSSLELIEKTLSLGSGGGYVVVLPPAPNISGHSKNEHSAHEQCISIDGYAVQPGGTGRRMGGRGAMNSIIDMTWCLALG